jgi:hypothetical protein
MIGELWLHVGGSLPHLYNDKRRPLVPSRFNSQANREWQRVSPNRERCRARGSHKEQAATPTSTRTRQEWQVPPFQQILHHPTVPSPQIMPLSGAQHNPSFLPTLVVPSTTPYASSANKRKRENHRSNRHALYQELQELVLKDQRRQPEGGEWEPIKIPYQNLAYIPKLTRSPSLLTRPRPPTCRQAIIPQNRVMNHSGNTTQCRQVHV